MTTLTNDLTVLRPGDELPIGRITLDASGLTDLLRERAAALADEDATNGVIPELNVHMSSSVAYTSGDTLDYDVTPDGRRYGVIRVTDVERARVEIADARRTAPTNVKRALSGFLRAIDEAIVEHERNRVTRKFVELRRDTKDFSAVEELNDLIKAREIFRTAESERIIGRDTTKALHRINVDPDSEYKTLVSVIAAFERRDGVISTLYTPTVEARALSNISYRVYQSYGNHRDGELNQLALTQGLTTEEASSQHARLSAANGRYLGEPLTTLDAAFDAGLRIVDEWLKAAIVGKAEEVLKAAQSWSDALDSRVHFTVETDEVGTIHLATEPGASGPAES